MAIFIARVLFVAAALVAIYNAQQLYREMNAPYREANYITIGVHSFSELTDRFQDLAHKKGAVYAFGVLREAKLPPGVDLHLLGHVVGDELYRQEGIDGIADCTQEFRNACSHTIVIGALTEFGEAALPQIDEACKKAPGGPGAYTMCYHGLGHGVFAYFGYDLTKTVAFCKKTGTTEYGNEQYTQCVGGAIMELMGGGGHDREKWLEARQKYLQDKPLAPCDSELIPTRAKSFCYIYLTPHLMQLAGADLGLPDPATFSKAFSFCDAIPASERKSRESCFGGFGKEFIGLVAGRDIRTIDRLTDQQYKTAILMCHEAVHQEGVLACVIGELESIFWGGENDPAASFRFCALVPEPMSEQCYAKLAEVIDRYLRDNDKKNWCAKLPEENQKTCLDT